MEAEGAPPDDAHRLTPAPSQPADADHEDIPHAPTAPAAAPDQPEPELSTADVQSLRGALAPESSPSVAESTVAEPEVEMSRRPSILSMPGSSVQRQDDGEPLAVRPRLDESAQRSVTAANNLDGHPSSSVRWNQRAEGQPGWQAEADTLASIECASGINPRGGVLSSVPAREVQPDDSEYTYWQQSVDESIWENSGYPTMVGQTESLELFGDTQDNITCHTVFHVDEMTGLAASKMQRTDELPRHKIPPQEWPRFLAATVKEWSAIFSTQAVTIIYPDNARKIIAQTPERVVPSRHVYREKPGEGIGACSSAKCRWCVLGHHDPDIMELKRSSPTPQTSSIYTFLLVAASLQRPVGLGDCKTAFMQSDLDHGDRPKGKLYAGLPPGGIPLEDGTWVPEGSIIQLNTAVYGLVNAPSAWRTTFVRALEDLGYRRSVYDPCIFCQMSKTGPNGHILIEVDDIAEFGDVVHRANMAKLQKTFKFGKWKSIYGDEGDYAGRTLMQCKDYGFKIHQAKFIEERLEPINIPKGRKSDKTVETSPGEKSQLRAVWGAVNWVQRETRPDVSGISSLGMGRILKSTVQDLCDANDCVAILKKEPYLGIIIPHIAPSKLRWATIQDASWANATEDKSQGAFLVGATTPELWKNQAAPFGLVSFKSHKMKRVVPSTLAAETQSMSEALAEVEWIRGLYEELTNPDFNIIEWSSKTRHRGLMVAARTTDSNRELEKLLTICDAKSLYDHLHSETAGCSADRRTAIEIQIIRSSLDAQDGDVRWVDHTGMYADAMTKKGGNLPLLQILMRTGRICISEETATLEKHKANPSLRSSSSKTLTDPAQGK